MTGEHSELTIELLPDPDTDDEELYRLSGQLRRMLLDLDVDHVELAGASEALAGTKAYHLEMGVLIVRLAARPDVLRSVVSDVRGWAGRQLLRGVKLTLNGDTVEITGPHSDTRDPVIDLWIARHASLG